MANSELVSINPSAEDVSDSALQTLRDRSAIRRKLLARSLGVDSTIELPSLLGTSSERCKLTNTEEKRKALSGFTADLNETASISDSNDRRRPSTPILGRTGDSTTESSPDVIRNFQDEQVIIAAKRLTDGSGDNDQKAKRRRTGDQTALDSDEDEVLEPFDDYFQVLQEEEKVFRGSATFLKGTQSANPHNDYLQHFIDTGQRPQNFIRDSGLAERFDEYPKLKELIKLKDELVATTATPPMYLKCDLRTHELQEIGLRFDVILIEPPLEEYHISVRDCWSWDQIESLDIGSLADTRSFIWLWCGSTPEGLQRGRDCLKRWGFRRCEDICWVKTNKLKMAKEHQEQLPGNVLKLGAGQLAAGNSLLQRTKEHCLMGIKGTVRRSTDGDFIHANVDIDLIITEEPAAGSIEKPLEIVLIAEHFCLGRRRLHLFGRDDTIRPGWLTVGPELTSSNFDASRYRRFFDRQTSSTSIGGYTTGCNERIEILRPKSPVPMDKRGGGNIGMMGHAANVNTRPDTNAGPLWQRSAGGGNNRDRTRGINVPSFHRQKHQNYSERSSSHDREWQSWSNNEDPRHEVTAGYSGRSDRFSPTRTYGSHRGSTQGRYRYRGDSRVSHFGNRRKF